MQAHPSRDAPPAVGSRQLNTPRPRRYRARVRNFTSLTPASILLPALRTSAESRDSRSLPRARDFRLPFNFQFSQRWNLLLVEEARGERKREKNSLETDAWPVRARGIINFLPEGRGISEVLILVDGGYSREECSEERRRREDLEINIRGDDDWPKERNMYADERGKICRDEVWMLLEEGCRRRTLLIFLSSSNERLIFEREWSYGCAAWMKIIRIIIICKECSINVVIQCKINISNWRKPKIIIICRF